MTAKMLQHSRCTGAVLVSPAISDGECAPKDVPTAECDGAEICEVSDQVFER
ncbi:MAG: hypothetical protein K6F02_06900 [Prevotella sp.]|nr:hypothetical protein [Prevotella sp.]